MLEFEFHKKSEYLFSRNELTQDEYWCKNGSLMFHVKHLLSFQGGG